MPKFDATKPAANSPISLSELRDHGAFLKGYSAEDEWFYDDAVETGPAALRARLKTFAEDWERPEASIYDEGRPR